MGREVKARGGNSNPFEFITTHSIMVMPVLYTLGFFKSPTPQHQV